MCKISLINQDCFDYLQALPDKSVNLVLTDTPYEVSRSTNFQSGTATGKDTDRFRVSMNFGDWDNNFTGLDAVIKECYRVLTDGGTIICFYDIWKITTLKKYFDDAKFRQIRFIEWLKTNSVPLNSKINYLTNSREIAVSGIKNQIRYSTLNMTMGYINIPFVMTRIDFTLLKNLWHFLKNLSLNIQMKAIQFWTVSAEVVQQQLHHFIETEIL